MSITRKVAIACAIALISSAGLWSPAAAQAAPVVQQEGPGVPQQGDGQAIAVPEEALATQDTSGPTFHFTNLTYSTFSAGSQAKAADSAASLQAWSGLPFNFTYHFTVSMESRRFRTTNGTICMSTDIYSNADMYAYVYADVWGADPQIGQRVFYPAAGGTYAYCWGGGTLSSDTTYYFQFWEKDDGYYYQGAGRAYQ